MKQKEKYIQFARNNAFKLKDGEDVYGEEFIIEIDGDNIVISADVGKHGTNEIFNEINLIQTITSKEFIEAVARGVWKEGKTSFKKDKIGYKKILGYWFKKEGVLDHITCEQAIAIRDNKFPEFIDNLLPKE